MATNRIVGDLRHLELAPILSRPSMKSARLKVRAQLSCFARRNKYAEGMSIYERPEDPQHGGNDRDLNASGNGSGTAAAPAAERANSKWAPEIFQDKVTAAEDSEGDLAAPGALEVPISYRNTVIGGLRIEDDTPFRNWEDEEVLMVKTVSDQLSVAISHARLFRQMETQAMTDALTGLYNHGYFQDRLSVKRS